MVLVLYEKSSGMMYKHIHHHNWFWFLHVYFHINTFWSWGSSV